MKLEIVFNTLLSHTFRIPSRTHGSTSSLSRLGNSLPQDVPMKNSIMFALGRRLPLDHDRLIGAPTGHYVFRRGAGGLLR